MTDRRIDRSVSAHIAGLEARVRHLETLAGGGTYRATQSDFVAAQYDTAGATFGSGGGPTVDVVVGRVGAIDVYLQMLVFGYGFDSTTPCAAAAFTLSGANTRAASNDEAIGLSFDGYDALAGTSPSFHSFTASATTIVEGLAPGLTTVEVVYVNCGGEGAGWVGRLLRVTPL